MKKAKILRSRSRRKDIRFENLCYGDDNFEDLFFKTINCDDEDFENEVHDDVHDYPRIQDDDLCPCCGRKMTTFNFTGKELRKIREMPPAEFFQSTLWKRMLSHYGEKKANETLEELKKLPHESNSFD